MCGNVWAEQIKSDISLKCSKSFIEQHKFSLENSKSDVPSELSFENSCSWKQWASRITVTFHWKFTCIENSIFFRRKGKKSLEFQRNTFALLLHNTVTINQIYHWRWFTSHSSQAVRLAQCLLLVTVTQYKSGVTLQNQTHSKYRTLYRRTANKMTWSNPRYNKELFYFLVWVFLEFFGLTHPTSRQVFYHERAREWEYLTEYQYLQRNENWQWIEQSNNYYLLHD